MNLLQSIVLGLVQGITEFFPISSSAHLRMAKWLLGLPDGEHLLYFDLLCHTGTLLALLIYLRRDVWDILCSPRKMALYFLALIPLIPAYFLLKPLRLAASDPAYLGYSLMITAALLFIASRKKILTTESTEDTEVGKPHTPNFYSFLCGLCALCGYYRRTKKYRDVLCIGVMQCAALVPGISRSGSTIAAARFCGWSWVEAARFSFLLAVPTILGGELLETMKIVKNGWVGTIPISCYAGGFVASFGLGLLAVRWVFWIYEKGKVRPFAWYCLGVGLFAWAIFRGS